MAAKSHIFHDPSGKRRQFFTLSVFLVVCFIIAGVLYAYKVFHSTPVLPTVQADQNTARLVKNEKNKKISSILLAKTQQDLEKEIEEAKNLANRYRSRMEQVGAPKVFAFYDSNKPAAYFSFMAHASKITDLIPHNWQIAYDFNSLETSSNYSTEVEKNEVLEKAQAEKIRLYARLSGNIAENIVAFTENAESQAKLIKLIVAQQKSEKLDGLVLDFPDLSSANLFALVDFFANLKEAWHQEFPQNSLGIILKATESDLPLWKLGQIFDLVFWQAPYEDQALANPGAFFSVSWFNKSLQFAVANIPPAKLILTFENFALDWSQGESVSKINYIAALGKARSLARDARSFINFDERSFNFNFSYNDEDGRLHTLWFSDAINSYNQYVLSYVSGIRQSAILSLGEEDPGNWSFIGEAPSDPTAELKDIQFPYAVSLQGQGDILSVDTSASTGERQIAFDSQSGLISKAEYLKLPLPKIVNRKGYQPGKVALTFDDGPSEQYTEEILNILEAEKVTATFFLIGERMQQHPDLVKRIYQAGHVIGNHTFFHPDLTSLSKTRQLLELNSTQRLAQSMLGRSLTLFRSPYMRAGSPATAGEVKVLERAEKLNYIPVGVSIDPEDWLLEYKNDQGEVVKRRAEDLVNKILSDLDSAQGNTIQFHDGIRKRENTVAALRAVIPLIKNRGYEFVTVADLLGVKAAEVMPAVTFSEKFIGGISRVYIEIHYWLKKLLELSFIFVAVLGILRLVSFIWLSKKSFKLEKPFDPAQKHYAPPVSIVIAAYNEEKVIVRTINSLLASEYADFEIIVVDDGSKDKTYQVVEEHFKNHPKVQLFTKENGGKSSALNLGIKHSKYEIIIGLDADTQYSPLAIATMARHFADPEIGAVAGNVKVGNRNSVLLQLQSTEYITNQNFGRRAFAALDAITVVPGAAGAWRKKAIEEVGYYESDTLGEDMELTWRIRKAGYRIVFEHRALAYTEAPDTMSGLFKQRFRWIYGQLQIQWKHRDVFFNPEYKWFGWFGAPLMSLDVIFLFLSPLADLQAIIALVSYFSFILGDSTANYEAWTEVAPLALFLKTIFLYVIFFIVEILCSVYAFKIDKEPLRPLWLIILKQFFYRQLMYLVAYRALWKALIGWRQNWGVLQRSGAVEIGKT